MSDKTDDLILSISTDVATLRRSLKKVEAAIGDTTGVAARKFDKLGQDIDKSMSRSLSKVTATTNRLGGVAAGAAGRIAAAFAGAASLKAASQLVDASTRITNSLKVTGLQGAALNDVYNKLRASALRNAAPLESLVSLYSKLSLSQKELGVSQAELTNFTDKIGLALRVGGTSATEASGALLQLSQALGGGTVRADEFNSVLEGTPTIVQAVAAGLAEAGGSVAKLRSLVIDGKVSSQAFFRAFEAGSVVLEQKVAGSVLTTSQNFENLQTVLIDTAGKIDKATGASSKFGGVIQELATTVEAFGKVVVQASDSELGAFVGWLSKGIDKASQFKKIMGGIPGILDKMGKLNQDLFNGRPLGTGLTEEAIQGRVKQAFDYPADPKTGRLPATTKVKTVSTVDHPVTGGTGSGSAIPIMNSDGRLTTVPVPEIKPIQLGDDPGKADDFKAEIGRLNERTASLRAAYAAQASLNPLIDDYGYTVDKAAAAQDLLNAALAAGKANTPALAAEIDAAAESYARATSAAEKLAEQQNKVRDQAKEAGKEIGDAFKNVFMNLIEGKSPFQAIADSLVGQSFSLNSTGFFQ